MAINVAENVGFELPTEVSLNGTLKPKSQHSRALVAFLAEENGKQMKLAVDAVCVEPVSVCISLLTGKITAIRPFLDRYLGRPLSHNLRYPLKLG